MRTEGKNRKKWAWWLLIATVGSQFYFVRELVAALAFFAIGFAAIAVVILNLYMLQKGWKAVVERLMNGKDLAESDLHPGRQAREMT